MKVKLRKIGGGSIRLKDKIVKPYEVFYYELKDIPKAFRDMFEEVKKEAKAEVAAKTKKK